MKNGGRREEIKSNKFSEQTFLSADMQSSLQYGKLRHIPKLVKTLTYLVIETKILQKKEDVERAPKKYPLNREKKSA